MTKEKLSQSLKRLKDIAKDLKGLKDLAEANEKTARERGGEVLENYYAGVKRGLQYALDWLDYYFDNEWNEETANNSKNN